MKEEAVATEPGDDSVDGRRRAFQGPGDLAVGHATDRELEDHWRELGATLPIRGAERLS